MATAIDFLGELEKQMAMEAAQEKIKETRDYKIRKIQEEQKKAKEICLDTIFDKIYKDAVPMNPDDSNEDSNDLDDLISDFIHTREPKGTEYYVKEAIKKGSKPAKMLLEAVDRLVFDIFKEYSLKVDEIKSDDINFDVDDPDVEKKLEEISSSMEFDELSEAIKNNVKVAVNDEIKRVQDERRAAKELEDSLKEDESITSEAAIERALTLRGVKDPIGHVYQPGLMEGIMINKLTHIEESGVDISDEAAQKIAFVESVKEYTKLSVLKSFALESFTGKDVNDLAKRYASMQEKAPGIEKLIMESGKTKKKDFTKTGKSFKGVPILSETKSEEKFNELMSEIDKVISALNSAWNKIYKKVVDKVLKDHESNNKSKIKSESDIKKVMKLDSVFMGIDRYGIQIIPWFNNNRKDKEFYDGDSLNIGLYYKNGKIEPIEDDAIQRQKNRYHL